MFMLISISYDNDTILENAKLGVKYLSRQKKNFIVANDLVQKEQENAKKNIKTLSMVKRAINDFRIISYFQPIINNKTKKSRKI
jgi:hypothetical protein